MGSLSRPFWGPFFRPFRHAFAEKGAPTSTGTTLHRISDEIVMNDMKAAGFEFIDNIHVLKNDWEDDLSKSVFDESVRGNTSRFVHKYRSPD